MTVTGQVVGQGDAVVTSALQGPTAYVSCVTARRLAEYRGSSPRPSLLLLCTQSGPIDEHYAHGAVLRVVANSE